MSTNDLSLREFLKKYATISDTFIDEYMKFYDLCASRKFGIPLNDVIKYLKIRNTTRFYEKFRKNYNVSVDCVILKPNWNKNKDKDTKKSYIIYHMIRLIKNA